MNQIDIEYHPLQPFLPSQAKLLMLGSFPPQQKRWCMEFYYPNYINDMWRIMGTIFYKDALHFVDTERKAFRKEEIISFAQEHGLAFYDTACAVRRLQDNASDKFLEVVKATDVNSLLEQLPECHAIVTTGQKATDTLRNLFSVNEPKVGCYETFLWNGRPMRFYRMPSSSRAYPMKLERKATYYAAMMKELGLL